MNSSTGPRAFTALSLFRAAKLNTYQIAKHFSARGIPMTEAEADRQLHFEMSAGGSRGTPESREAVKHFRTILADLGARKP